jgi:hypothetical protein
MIEILAAYLFLKCYVSFDADAAAFKLSGRTTEQCLAEFKKEVERLRASPTAQRARYYWQRTKEQTAACLTQEQLDRLLYQVRERIRVAQASKK